MKFYSIRMVGANLLFLVTYDIIIIVCHETYYIKWNK